jgi:putative flavoprotein involved in K+ transport
MNDRQTEHFETIVIGGGQAGLTVGYHLKKSGGPFVILDANERVGDAWRKRWDSLRLFTPARYCALPGYRFPAPRLSFPTKDQMADYLESYAARFELPIRTGVSIDRVAKENGRFVVEAGGERLEADNVVVATGAHQIPKAPAFASELDPAIRQLHSSEYRGPSDLQGGDVLVVGVGNSGAEIAFELAETRRCLLAGRNPGQIPVRHGSLISFPFFLGLRFLGHKVLRTDTRIGRKVGAKIASNGAPLIRRREKDLAAVGIERVARVAGVRDGRPVLEDDSVLDVANVVWCTGFRTEFGWIDVPAFAEDGQPLHTRGVVESEPGLYFVGLIFQYSLTSDVLPSRGRDAEYIAKHIAARVRSASTKSRQRALAAA